MLVKTHIAIVIFFMILFAGIVNYPFAFIIVTLIATILPDIDTAFSTIGKHKAFRILQAFTKHRGILHSFTFAFVISLLFALFLPIFAFPFFLGYGIHLIADSFTVEGLAPFWPYSRRAQWKIKVGGKFEELIFLTFFCADILLVILSLFQ